MEPHQIFKGLVGSEEKGISIYALELLVKHCHFFELRHAKLVKNHSVTVFTSVKLKYILQLFLRKVLLLHRRFIWREASVVPFYLRWHYTTSISERSQTFL